MLQDLRVPPYSQDAEYGVLGSILIHVPCYAMLKAETDLCADAFYIPANRLVWEAIESLAAIGRPCDLLTVTDAMRGSGSLEKCGGPLFLDGIIEATPTHTHVEHYAEIVISKWRLRKAITAARSVESEAMDPNADGLEVAAHGIQGLSEILRVKDQEVTVQEAVDASITTWDSVALTRAEGKAVALPGLPTGLHRLDEALNGIQTGLLVIGARQSTGKTSAMSQFEANICRTDGSPVLRITRDSPFDMLVKRDMCREAQCDLPWLSNGHMTAAQRKRLVDCGRAIAERPIRTVTTVWKLPDLCALIRSDVQKRGTKLVSIDYAQVFSTGNRAADNDRNGKLETIMGGLKNLMFELGIPIVILSQFARDKDGIKGRVGVGNWLSSRPVLEDLKDSGSLEQLADQAILMSKVDDILDEDGVEGRRTVVAFDVAKNKQGSTRVVFMDFHRPFFTFTEFSEQQQKAVVKALQDDGKKVEKCKQPYFEGVQDALNRHHLMENA